MTVSRCCHGTVLVRYRPAKFLGNRNQRIRENSSPRIQPYEIMCLQSHFLLISGPQWLRPQLYGLGYLRKPSPWGNFIKHSYVKTVSLWSESKLTLHDYSQPLLNDQMCKYPSFFEFSSVVQSYLIEGNGYGTRQSSLLYVFVIFFGKSWYLCSFDVRRAS